MTNHKELNIKKKSLVSSSLLITYSLKLETDDRREKFPSSLQIQRFIGQHTSTNNTPQLIKAIQRIKRVHVDLKFLCV